MEFFSSVLFCCWHCLLSCCFALISSCLLLFIVFTLYVLAARITQCILCSVKMQSDYFAPVRCAVPILRVLTMILRGIIDAERIVSSATYTLAALCLVSKLRMWPVFKVTNTCSEDIIIILCQYCMHLKLTSQDYGPQEKLNNFSFMN